MKFRKSHLGPPDQIPSQQSTRHHAGPDSPTSNQAPPSRSHPPTLHTKTPAYAACACTHQKKPTHPPHARFSNYPIEKRVQTCRVKLSSAASLGFSKVSKETLGLYPGTGVEPPVSVRWIVGGGEKVCCEWFGDAGTSWTCGGLYDTNTKRIS